MKKIQKVLVGSMAFAMIITSTVMPNVLAKSSQASGTHPTTQSDKAKGNSNGSQKDQKKQDREAEKAAVKATYSKDELAKLQIAGDKIKKNNKNITVLPVENVIVKGAKVKFDTPPVIKSGRTLIPVKAISEALGAKVQWVAAEKKIVITKGTTEIVLQLDSNKIYVNGVESTIDVPACSINGRTVVPLKFIVEKLGLLVKWDSDSQVVEIENPNPTTPADTTATPTAPADTTATTTAPADTTATTTAPAGTTTTTTAPADTTTTTAPADTTTTTAPADTTATPTAPADTTTPAVPAQ